MSNRSQDDQSTSKLAASPNLRQRSSKTSLPDEREAGAEQLPATKVDQQPTVEPSAEATPKAQANRSVIDHKKMPKPVQTSDSEADLQKQRSLEFEEVRVAQQMLVAEEQAIDEQRLKKSQVLRERLNNELNRLSLDQCVKCTICETSCPVAAATPLFSGPKFVGPQAERFRQGVSVDQSIDYCSSCGTCSVVCPQGVNVAEINSLARAVMKTEQGIPIRDRLITKTVLMGTVMSPVASVANGVLRNKFARLIMEKMIGVHRHAPMPEAKFQTLHGWLHSRPPIRRTPAPRGTVVFFHGCAGGFFEVDAAKRAIEVLEFLGYDVLVPQQGCCGLAEQSNGLFKKASASVLGLVRQLKATGEGLTIVSTAGSCAGMIKHEAHEILGLNNADLADISVRMREISEFLLELYDGGALPLSFRTIPLTLPYHQPCQVRSQGMGMPALELLRLIPGLNVIESGVACCGIAGTYGLKKEKYDVAQAVGKPLFDMIASSGARFVACDTETCRWQIQGSTKVRTLHPIVFVHAAYGLGQIPAAMK